MNGSSWCGGVWGAVSYKSCDKNLEADPGASAYRLSAYLKAYDSVSAARADIADYLQWYNTGRVHSSLDDVTPEQA